MKIHTDKLKNYNSEEQTRVNGRILQNCIRQILHDFMHTVFYNRCSDCNHFGSLESLFFAAHFLATRKLENGLEPMLLCVFLAG